MKKLLFLMFAASLLLGLSACQKQAAQPPAAAPEPADNEITPDSDNHDSPRRATTMSDEDIAWVTALLETHRGDVETMEAALIEAGYPLFADFSTLKANPEAFLAYLEDAKAGRDSHAAGYDVLSGDSITAYTYFYERGEYSRGYLYFTLNEEGICGVSSGGRDLFEDLTLTDTGIAIITYPMPISPSGFRLIPIEPALQAAFETYVAPLGHYPTPGPLSFFWDEAHQYESIIWPYTFQQIYRSLPDHNPEYVARSGDIPNDWHVVVPADVVENLLQSYFSVSTETLRAMTEPYNESRGRCYDPDTQTYSFYGYRGGGGLSPAVEVWGLRENPDGSLSLDIALSYAEMGSDGYVASTLTVVPQPDGSFRYRSNVFSDDSIRQMVETRLDYAQWCNLLATGVFKLIGGDPMIFDGSPYGAINPNGEAFRSIRMGGQRDLDWIRTCFRMAFTDEAAARYLSEILPHYRVVGEGDEAALYVNTHWEGYSLVEGTYNFDNFAVLGKSPREITVQLTLDTYGAAPQLRELTMAYSDNMWRFTDSYGYTDLSAE